MGCLNYLTLYLYLIKSPVLGIRGGLEIPLLSMVTCTVCTHDDTGSYLPRSWCWCQWRSEGAGVTIRCLHQDTLAITVTGADVCCDHVKTRIFREAQWVNYGLQVSSSWPVRACSYSVRIIKVVSVQKGFQLSRLKYPWVWNLIFWIHC